MLAADAKRKRKQEIDKKSREKKKKKLENNVAQLKTLQDECSYYKGQLDLCEKSLMKPFGKFAQELGESGGHTRDTVEKQTDMVNECWDIIKRKKIMQPLPDGRTCGGVSASTDSGVSASTDKDAYPPLELSVAAIKSDGSTNLKEELARAQAMPYSILFEEKEPPML
ncbi:hypothetical protein NC651_006315 [Populus alba x Populus x berolinensis]|nr:hypothetical protein NC651_006315 [Populus alba x Populus x berolinensis]